MQQTVGDEEARQALDFLREETKGISLLSLGLRGGAWPVTGWARPLCVSMSKTVETWILQERRTSAVANREAGLPKNRVHAAKLSLSANPIVRYDAIG